MSNRRAFTLVEMTIVIGIIILLAGLTLAVSVSVVQGSEIRQTELTVQLLDSAILEWQTQADRRITYGKLNEPFNQARYDILQPNLPPDDPELAAVLVTRKLLAIVMRPESTRQILAQIDPEFIERSTVDHDDDAQTPVIESMIVSDAWGNPYIAVLPGRSWVVGDDTTFSYLRDDDGSIRTGIETICGVAVNRQICFVSAGPDGKFGMRNAAAGSVEFEQTTDNLYSYVPTVSNP